MQSSLHSSFTHTSPEHAPAPPTARLTLIPELVPSPLDTDTPRNSIKCVICEDVNFEEYPEADTFVDVLDRPLLDASLTPRGYVCSRPCMSQLMFQSADKDRQEKMLRFERAIGEIAETAPYLADIFNEWDMDLGARDLAERAADVRSQLGCGRRSAALPKWIEENDAPEIALKAVLRDSLHELDWNVVTSLIVDIQVELRKIGDTNFARPIASPYKTGCAAKALGSLGNVMLRMKAALQGAAR